MGEKIKEGIINFAIKGKVGVAVIGVLLSAILVIGYLQSEVATLKDNNLRKDAKIETLEKNCNLISISLARIEENTKNLTEKIQDLKHTLEVRK